MTLKFVSVLLGGGLVLLAAAPALAETASPWQVRLRVVHAWTDGGGALDGVPGSDLSYSSSIVPEFDVSYYLTDNIAVEAIFGTSPHKIYGEGTIGGLRVGKAWLLPPTVTLQYHLTGLGGFKPYVGAGVNYTIFYNQKGYDVQDLDVKNAWGFALQAGADYMIGPHWGVNVDVKKIFLETDYSLRVGAARMTGDADIDPWFFSTGITYRF